ncbi:hypothetical protein BZA05DRAFT_401652 [Tricharina praecox]|uniref:uncharacterized protein n=1 Tax=Tricharina praecox TaxID=43433 RepID=UPI00221F39D8|nr:uncharacterized protein BZA05DRAFT_401652 [Tricharina praecox]KAI5849817.1 hypothetical protein BZA05DRAFT_401652 [Tricharina praecox]
MWWVSWWVSWWVPTGCFACPVQPAPRVEYRMRMFSTRPTPPPPPLSSRRVEFWGRKNSTTGRGCGEAASCSCIASDRKKGREGVGGCVLCTTSKAEPISSGLSRSFSGRSRKWKK